MSGREFDTRLSAQRASVSDKPRLRLDIDITGLPEDMELVWVREMSGGAYDEGNIEDAMLRGAVPATTDILPKARRTVALPGRPPPKDNLIRRGDTVLMMFPKEEQAAQRRAHADLQRSQIATVQRIGSDPGAKLDSENFIEASSVKDRVERSGGEKPPSQQKAKFTE